MKKRNKISRGMIDMGLYHHWLIRHRHFVNLTQSVVNGLLIHLQQCHKLYPFSCFPLFFPDFYSRSTDIDFLLKMRTLGYLTSVYTDTYSTPNLIIVPNLMIQREVVHQDQVHVLQSRQIQLVKPAS